MEYFQLMTSRLFITEAILRTKEQNQQVLIASTSFELGWLIVICKVVAVTAEKNVATVVKLGMPSERAVFLDCMNSRSMLVRTARRVIICVSLTKHCGCDRKHTFLSSEEIPNLTVNPLKL